MSRRWPREADNSCLAVSFAPQVSHSRKKTKAPLLPNQVPRGTGQGQGEMVSSRDPETWREKTLPISKLLCHLPLCPYDAALAPWQLLDRNVTRTQSRRGRAPQSRSLHVLVLFALSSHPAFSVTLKAHSKWLVPLDRAVEQT